ncbi:Mur ligase family protein [Halarcobacter sp.]|uniref:Mur ligase family protein n=1 Tax=Halarcobacter sp. TaxID=2321133 RepID=UPI0029F59549|nr:Mur ligase family protein [Halarcobacter sp.]
MDGITALKQIDKKQLWRLFIDGRFHKKYRGWTGYENQESGSTQGMINAYTHMLENFDLSKGVSCHYLRNLHHICMFNVHSTLREASPGDLRCEETGFKFFAARTTLEFFKELFELRKDDNVKLFHNSGFEKPAKDLDVFDVYKRLMKRGKLQFNPWFPELDEKTKNILDQKGSFVEFYEAKSYVQLQFAKKMEGIVNRFNEKLHKLEGEDNIISEIAKFIQEIELLHPFPDGNCRTFLTLTNHLLLYKGLLPTMIENPNFDGTYSYKEYAYEIKKGIECTKKLLKNPNEKLYNYSIEEASAEEISKFKQMASKFISTIDKFAFEKPLNVDDSIYLTPENLTKITGGKWINFNPNILYSRVGTHSDAGKDFISFFVSLADWRKENLSYEVIMERINSCVKKGVNTIVVDKEEYAKGLKIPVLVVDDVTSMLRKVAIEVREKVDPQTVFVGGTVGKTGFKIQLHNCLKDIVSTHAILNSGNIKLPILYSLASLKSDDKVEIVEVSGAAKYSWGASRSKIISPNICVFTDINLVHMDIHKSVENLIRNKASAVEGLRENGICVVNNDAIYAKELKTVIKEIRDDAKIITFGTSKENDAYIISKEFNSDDFSWNIKAMINKKEIEYNLPLFQNHAPIQSLGVLLVVDSLGYDTKEAALNYKNISTFQTMGRVFRITDDKKSFVFYDQSLRGSIQGMESALNDLKNFKIKGKKIALLGGSSIEEDGEFTKLQHEKLAKLLNESDIDILYTTGPYLNYLHDNLNEDLKAKLKLHSDNRELLVEDLTKNIENDDCVFVMGSAYLRLGNVGQYILSLGKKEQIG